MKYTERECTIFNAMLHDWLSIDCDSALAERGLEYEDYKYMGLTIDIIRYEKQCYVESKRVADYFASFGIKVTDYINEWLVKL